jgi:hypothetical protein
MKFTAFLVAALALAATPLPAAADDATPSTATFIADCSKAENRDACADVLAEYELDSQAPCPAGLDAVLADLRRHPDWSNRPWTDSVASALAEVCRK